MAIDDICWHDEKAYTNKKVMVKKFLSERSVRLIKHCTVLKGLRAG